jgi:crotonobetainyl-CoA:carnitine CoA-transferase CaiB-like acyl-CoA transferase
VAAGLERPKPLPAQALDHATGYLAAFGTMVALARRAREGGSYQVRVSLAQTGRWIDRLGRVDGQDVPDPTVEDVDEYLQTTEASFGLLRHVAPAAKLSETPARWARPPVPLGTHTPDW